MSLYIIKINKNKNIYISKNLSLLENYENKKEIFKASLLVNYFNAIDKESQYFSVYEEDLVEKINKKLNTSKKKLKLKDILPHGKPFLLFKYEEKNVKMHLRNGKTLTIDAPKNSKENIYIQSIQKNGNAYDKTFITYDDILKGSTFKLQMDKKANKNRGIEAETKPYSMSNNR